MPVPLPPPDRTDLEPPGAAEVTALARGVLTAVAPPGGATGLQRLLVGATFEAMTGHRVDVDRLAPLGAEETAEALRARNEAFRTRILQTMILCALVLRPLPPDVAARVGSFARAMSVDDGMLAVARRFAAGQLGLAAFDFERNGYTAGWSPERAAALRASGLDGAWQQSTADPALAARWAGLEHLPRGTIGRRIWELYRARGFAFPGSPGSAPPLLAQHDWVHVLADYGTTVESELEVFAFIARANDDPRGFSLLAMVVSLFETGYLATGAGLFESLPGRLSRDGMAVRLADALLRGARTHGFGGRPDVDLLAVDWFALADRPLDDLRAAMGVTPKSAAALAAGSAGPWEPGGISEHQAAAGRAAAAAAGVPYDAHGAAP